MRFPGPNWNRRKAATISRIEKILCRTRSLNKHLVILLELKSFNPQILPVPTYMRTEVYEGVQLPSAHMGRGSARYNLKLWNSGGTRSTGGVAGPAGETLQRPCELRRHPVSPETALGQPIELLSSHDTEKFYDNLLDVQRQMRAAFPNT